MLEIYFSHPMTFLARPIFFKNALEVSSWNDVDFTKHYIFIIKEFM